MAPNMQSYNLTAKRFSHNACLDVYCIGIFFVFICMRFSTIAVVSVHVSAIKRSQFSHRRIKHKKIAPLVNCLHIEMHSLQLICVWLILQGKFIFALLDFNVSTFGVKFMPYVKLGPFDSVQQAKDSIYNYNFGEVQVMIEIIASKFSNLITFAVHSNPAPFVHRVSYYDSLVIARTAEAAALFNNKSRCDNPLSVIVGIELSGDKTQDVTQALVAVEASEIANSIFKGTVDKLVIIPSSREQRSDVLQTIRWLRKMTVSGTYKIGAVLDCELVVEISKSTTLVELTRQILRESDFVICNFINYVSNGHYDSFADASYNYLRERAAAKVINPIIEVMGYTKWPNTGDHKGTLELVKYWREVNQFSSKHNYRVYMADAFDSAIDEENFSKAHSGWWKYISTNHVEKLSDFMEKATNKSLKDIPGNNRNIYDWSNIFPNKGTR